MIDIGSCYFHIVYDSLETRIQSTVWEVKNVLEKELPASV